MVLALVAVIVSQHWTLAQYAITPGNATPVAPLVAVSGVSTDATHDRILLTDVYLTRITAWGWLVDHFSGHVQFLTPGELLEPGVPTSELDAQGYLEMSDSQRAAKVAAFRALGWRVAPHPTGAVVNAVIDPSPAFGARLRVGDEIVGFDGASVDSACALVARAHALAPGTRVRLALRPVRISAKGVLTRGAVVERTLRTAPVPSSIANVAASPCRAVSGRDRSWLGISLEDGVSYRLPARVTINTANIGGPSAGLAMTLTLIDQLSAGSLTGGHVVAATGTMNARGVVGDVGGVAEKTVAVQRAGAQYFIVPRVEVATARANAAPGLTILGVRTLAQALADLRRIGGAAPRALTRPS